MSISLALSNAQSGLAFNARGAQVVGSNIANALTPDHVRTELNVTVAAGGGVSVTGIARAVDLPTFILRLEAKADLGASETALATRGAIAEIFATPDGESGLAATVNAMSLAYSQVAVAPDSKAAIDMAIAATERTASAFNEAARGLRALRNEADAAIARRVDSLNEGLGRVEDLNRQIITASARRQDTIALEQARDDEILALSAHVPLSIVARESGAIALFTTGGGVLLDGRAASLSFRPAGVVADGATIADGGVSSISLNGIPVTFREGGLFDGGGLAAEVHARDTLVPEAQQHLDLLALQVLTRMETASTAGAPAILTDGGSVADPSDLLGMSVRMSVRSDLMDPASARETVIDVAGAVSGALEELAPNLSAIGDPVARTMPDHIATVAAALHVAEDAAELQMVRAAAHEAAAREAHAARTGVDSDAQLQLLLTIENAYAANARVLSTVDAMLRQLLEI